MELYEFKYNDYHNKITITPIEMRETAKSYKPVGDNGLSIYKEKLPKDDVGKLIVGISTYCYYSADNDVKVFLSELDKKYECKIDSLTKEIQRIQEQKERIKSANIVTNS